MGEEVVKITDFQGEGGASDYGQRVAEWEMGLPTADDLTPLSQPLIPPELASAFSISPEPHRTLLDVNRASRNTLSAIRGGGGGGGCSHSQAFSFSSNNNNNNFNSFNDEDHRTTRDPMAVLPLEAGEEAEPDPGRDRSDSRKLRKKNDCGAEEADSAPPTENSNSAEDPSSARTLKRPRLVWTPQLHKRFVDVVAHLGIKNAVPKTIMQLMNVEGLTRENVASHLQKYRLYLKRIQGLSNDNEGEGPSSSDQLFASTPVPQSIHDSGGGSAHSHSHGNGHLPVPVPVPVPIPIPMPYPPPPMNMMPMPVLGLPQTHGHGHMGMPMPVCNPPATAAAGYHHDFDSNPFNNTLPLQQSDWSASANKYASVVSYPHTHSVVPNDK